MKTYCIIANASFASRSDIQEFLDQEPRVSTWYACLPSCVFATSEMSAQELAKAMESHFGNGTGQRFLVMAVSRNRQGRLPKDLWQLFRDPSHVNDQ
jgi:hypothetical protein